jgi:hypothetical protein
MDRSHISNNYGWKCADRRVAEAARRRHGVVSLADLIRCGLTPRQVQHRVETGRLHRIHAGVYAVGHPLVSPLGRCMAAALAAGEGGVLSHRGAVWLWGMPQSLPETLDVTCPRRRRSRPALRCHEAELPADERAVHEGIPVTSPSRSILDVAARTEPHRLERMIEAGEDAGLDSQAPLPSLLRRYPRKPGTPRLRRILGIRDEARLTRSDWEAMTLAFCDRQGFDRPLTSVLFPCEGRTYELDAFWPDRRLALEFDSWEHHGGKQAFREDRIRDRALHRAGVRTIRVTAYDFGPGAAALADDLGAILAAALV